MTRRDLPLILIYVVGLIVLILLPSWIDHNSPAPDYTVQLPTLPNGEQP